MGLYIDITISKSSTLSVSVLLIFEMQPMKGALFVKANFLPYASFGSVTVIVLLITMYTSL